MYSESPQEPLRQITLPLKTLLGLSRHAATFPFASFVSGQKTIGEADIRDEITDEIRDDIRDDYLLMLISHRIALPLTEQCEFIP